MTDRRYGRNKYGDGKLYGASTPRDALAWDVSIDWDEDGLLETNDAHLLIDVDIDRGRKLLLRGFGEGFESVPTGTAKLTFRNDDGRFDAWNSSSALYPNINYDKDLKVRVRDLSDDARYSLFSGFITNIEPNGYGDNATVTITASDGLEYLRNLPARVSMQTDITTDEAIGKVLDAVNWPRRWGRSLDSVTDVIPYWWASGNKIASSELEDLALSFLGYFFVDANGRARFTSRGNVGSSVANYLQEHLAKDIGNPQPYTIRRNVTRLKVHPRTKASSGTIWELIGNTPSINAGESITLFANYTYQNTATPAINVVTPVGTTDFLVNSAASGLGTDLTGSCTVTLTDFGDTAKLVIHNGSGVTGYVVFLKVRGEAVYEKNVSDVTYPTDPSSIKNPRELLLDLPWQQDVNVAIDMTNLLGPYFDMLHPMPNVKILDRPSLQYAADLFDIANANLGRIGLSGESFRVGGIQHKTQRENCQSVLTRIYLEPYVSMQNAWLWDTRSVWDVSTIFGG